MKKFLLLVIVCMSLAGFAFAEDFSKSNLTSGRNAVVVAEDKPIKFTETQKKTLEDMVMANNIAQNRIKDFVNYLVAEYKVDSSYTISKDMSGFEKVPQPPKLQSNRDEKDNMPIEQKPAEVKK